MIIRPVLGTQNTKGELHVNARCPACRRDVTFNGLGFHDPIVTVSPAEGPRYRLGSRVCGNPECRAHLFVVIEGNELVASYPPETIDFDASHIPARVVDAFEEAIQCHAQQCYIAAAIMVRKTPEEVCADRGATGNTLKARIEALGSVVVLPQPMLDALDDLRLLGNDAAHLESRVYEEIGLEELEVAIDVAKEILKATYQYEGLMGRLAALKRERANDA